MILANVRTAFTALCLGLISLCAQGQDSDDISIESPWIRSAPPTVEVMAGYLTLHNRSDRKIILTEINSASFASVEVHKTELNQGMMRMAAVKPLTLAPRSTLRFEPGGYHLMLSGPKQAIPRGAAVSLEFVFDNGQRLTVTAMVKDDDTGNEGEGHGHQHH